MSRILRYLPAFALIGILVFAVACGSDANAGSSGASSSSAGSTVTKFADGTADQKINVSADPTGAFKWTAQSYTAKAGDVTFVVKNPSVVVHNFGIEGPGVNAHSANINANGTLNATLKGLKPGEYTIVCTVAGHREGGMVAKLIVQ